MKVYIIPIMLAGIIFSFLAYDIFYDGRSENIYIGATESVFDRCSAQSGVLICKKSYIVQGGDSIGSILQDSNLPAGSINSVFVPIVQDDNNLSGPLRTGMKLVIPFVPEVEFFSICR